MAMMSTKQLLIMIDRISRDGQSREKVLRGLGYVFKQIANEMTIYAPKSEYKKPFEKLAAMISDARRIYRQFKYMEAIQSLTTSIHNPDILIRIFNSLKYISLVVHHFWDQFVLLHVLNFISLSDFERARKVSLGGWWASIWFQMVLDLYSYIQCVQKLGEIDKILYALREKSDIDDAQREKFLAQQKGLQQKKFLLILNTVKNIFDLPAATEGTFKSGRFTPRQVSIGGAIASFVGLYLVYPSK